MRDRQACQGLRHAGEDEERGVVKAAGELEGLEVCGPGVEERVGFGLVG